MAKQRRGKFKSRANPRTATEARTTLVEASVSASTQKIYTSKLRGLQEFLKKQRKSQSEEAETMTEDEFMQFLDVWKEDGMGSAEGHRSALLWLHRRQGVVSFCEKKVVKLATEAAGKGTRGPDKGVLTQRQVDELVYDLSYGKLGDYYCKTCATHGWTPESSLQALILAVRMMTETFVRPGVLPDLTVNAVYRTEGGAVVKVFDKVVQGDVEKSTTQRVLDMTHSVERPGNYVFPRCIQSHLAATLRDASVEKGWDSGLVWSPMCLRHTAHMEMGKKVEDMVRNLVHELGGSSPGVTKQHYMKALVKRRRDKKD